MPPASKASFFIPDSTTTRTTRKRALNAAAAYNNDTNTNAIGDETNASKRVKPASKKVAVKKTLIKKAPGKTAGKKAANFGSHRTPAKLYKDTVANVDKTLEVLENRGAYTDVTAAVVQTVPVVCQRIACI